MPNCSNRLMPIYADSPCRDCKIRIKSGRCRNWCDGYKDYKAKVLDLKQKEKDSGISPNVGYSSVKSFF